TVPSGGPGVLEGCRARSRRIRARVAQVHATALRYGHAGTTRDAARTAIVDLVSNVGDDVLPVVRVRHRDGSRNLPGTVGEAGFLGVYRVFEYIRVADLFDERLVDGLIDAPIVSPGVGRRCGLAHLQ